MGHETNSRGRCSPKYDQLGSILCALTKASVVVGEQARKQSRYTDLVYQHHPSSGRSSSSDARNTAPEEPEVEAEDAESMVFWSE